MSAAAFSQAGANATLAIVLGLTLGGCAVLGSNVKGGFSCAAPDGICAPSSTIDDQALVLITGEAADAATMPAGPYAAARPRAPMRRDATAAPATGPAIGAARTQERVLRIVFMPYIDARGRLHEASAVHAVVQPGAWQSDAIGDATRLSDPHAAAAPAEEPSLAQIVDRTDRRTSDAALDPNLPDAAVVAAARARKADPIAAIRADVAARLEAGPARTIAPIAAKEAVTGARGRAADTPARPRAGAPSPRAAAEAKQGSARISASPAPMPGTAAEARDRTSDPAGAQARLKADPHYRMAQEAVKRTAQKTAQKTAQTTAQKTGRRQAAGARLAPKKAPIGPTVRAAPFPAAITEDP